MRDFDWNTEAVEMLKSLYKQNVSFGQMAQALNARFHSNVSRNACIGKALRLGLTGKAPEKGGRGKVALRRAAAEVTWAKPAPKPKVLPAPKPISYSARNRPLGPVTHADRYNEVRWANEVATEALNVALLDMDERQCRWPTDRRGDVQLYCGQPTEGRKAYCAHCNGRRVEGATKAKAKTDPGFIAPRHERAKTGRVSSDLQLRWGRR